MTEHLKHIRMDADLLRKRIAGGKLYGLDVDMNDPDMLIVAAFLVGWNDGRGSPMDFDDMVPRILGKSWISS